MEEMNARQTKKYLKKQIAKLRLDNDLMRRIIADSSKMQELYDVWTKPLSATRITIPFQEFKAKRMITLYLEGDVERIIENVKQAVAQDLLEDIKENITYEIDTENKQISITGSIIAGRR